MVQGFLTLFAFLLAGAYINPAATAIEFLAGNIKPRRFAALRACPVGGAASAALRRCYAPLCDSGASRQRCDVSHRGSS